MFSAFELYISVLCLCCGKVTAPTLVLRVSLATSMMQQMFAEDVRRQLWLSFVDASQRCGIWTGTHRVSVPWLYERSGRHRDRDSTFMKVVEACALISARRAVRGRTRQSESMFL